MDGIAVETTELATCLAAPAGGLDQGPVVDNCLTQPESAAAVQLDDAVLSRAVDELVSRDEQLAKIVRELGAPPLWQREPGFATLLHMLLEQQVSLASAQAAYDRLLSSVTILTPAAFLQLSDHRLRAVGFSRQKARYGRSLAAALNQGNLDLSALHALDDDGVRALLMQVDGIGPWTADIYLLMALGRPDVWPRGDLALAVALQRLRQLPRRPSPGEAAVLSRAWMPWRAVAARILWHYYLSQGQPTQPSG